jgi:hypothetical protein
MVVLSTIYPKVVFSVVFLFDCCQNLACSHHDRSIADIDQRCSSLTSQVSSTTSTFDARYSDILERLKHHVRATEQSNESMRRYTDGQLASLQAVLDVIPLSVARVKEETMAVKAEIVGMFWCMLWVSLFHLLPTCTRV